MKEIQTPPYYNTEAHVAENILYLLQKQGSLHLFSMLVIIMLKRHC